MLRGTLTTIARADSRASRCQATRSFPTTPMAVAHVTAWNASLAASWKAETGLTVTVQAQYRHIQTMNHLAGATRLTRLPRMRGPTIRAKAQIQTAQKAYGVSKYAISSRPPLSTSTTW